MSLPCVIGENGINYIVKETLTDEEKEKLLKSASILLDIQRELNLWSQTRQIQCGLKEDSVTDLIRKVNLRLTFDQFHLFI